MPDLPSQPQGITAHWLVPNYTAWWQRHMRITIWPGLHSTGGRPGFESATCWLQVQRPNHSDTEPQDIYIKTIRHIHFLTAFTLLAGQLERHPVCKKSECWCAEDGDLTGASWVHMICTRLKSSSVTVISSITSCCSKTQKRSIFWNWLTQTVLEYR